MKDWATFPNNPGIWPNRGDLVHFKRGNEISEPIRVSHVDMATKSVYFLDDIPLDVREGDEMISEQRGKR